MRRRVRVVATALAAATLVACSALAIPASKPGEFKLTGLWESTETSSGGIGHAMEFRPDGTFVEATVVLVDMPYRLVGNRVLVGPDAQASRPGPASVFEGGALVQTRPDGSVVRKERLRGSAPRSTTVVGSWRYCHDTGATAYERYTETRQMQFRLPIAASTGRYWLRGEVLTLTVSGKPDVQATVKPRGENLVIAMPEGRPAEYRRERAGAWYEIGRVERCSPAPAAAVVSPAAPAPPAGPAPAPAVVDRAAPAALVELPSASASPEIARPARRLDSPVRLDSSGPAAAPARERKNAARPDPPIERFLGTWRNVDPKIDSWPRVEIRAKRDELTVHIWGKCHPADCDLGTLTAPYTGAPIVLFQDLGFVKSRFTLRLEGDTLRMTMASHFTDDSGRPDGVHEARFRK